MGATPICVVSATGIERPDFATVLAYFTTGYQNIYGSDTYLGSDSQDGEFMGLLGQAVDDCNAETVSAYNAYSPATAQGAGLSSNVKINGLARDVPTNSSVPASIVGVAFTTFPSIYATDPANNTWALLSSVTIPGPGAITATFTCLVPGAVQLASGTVLTISNPTLGLQSITTTANATPGSPAETDAQLRIRQSLSTALPSSTMLDGIQAAVLAVPGVVAEYFKIYQNDEPSPDDNGIPGNSIAVVVEGGDSMAIAQAIAGSKFACGTYGTTTETIIDSIGVAHAINFFELTQTPITLVVNLTPGSQFSTNTIALIQQSLASWINANGTGNNVQLTRTYQAGYLGPSISSVSAQLQQALNNGSTTTAASLAVQLTALTVASNTYEINSILIGVNGGTPVAADGAIAFNAAAYIEVDSNNNPVNPNSIVVNI